MRPRAPLRAHSGAASHRGLVRELNEDCCVTYDDRGLWAVADGMGGHARGDIASGEAIHYLGFVRGDWPGPAALGEDIRDRLEDANRKLLKLAAEAGAGPIATTVVCAALFGGHALIAWAGDSRAYLLRAGAPIRRLTRDHSQVQELIDAGRLDPEAAEAHPLAHVVTRAIGVEEPARVEFAEVALRPGDRLLLCSDGLTRTTPDAGIAALSALHRDPIGFAGALIDAALEAGGPDNVTAVAVDVR